LDKENMTQQQGETTPWLDYRLTKETMNHLWDMMNHHATKPPTESLRDFQICSHGPNNKVYDIEDKNDWFFENVLKECSERLYYKDWNNYYNVHIGQGIPPTVFVLEEMWVNHQKQHEYIPPHYHAGAYSFVVFMKIPIHWKEQQELPWLKNVEESRVSNFQFLLSLSQTQVQPISIPLSPEDEGRMLFFPAWITHQVFPFYECEEERITISGNIITPIPKEKRLKRLSHLQYIEMKKEVDEYEKVIKKEKKN
jgi:hypothetical protein